MNNNGAIIMTEIAQRNIYQRINEVMKAVKYVQKDKSVSGGGQNYKAVTHDQAISVVRESIVENGIMIFPNQISGEFLVMRDVNAEPQPIKMGLYTGTYEINFVNIDDGNDKVTVTVQAHAADNGDKAPGKALTYATKAAILKVFSLESGEDDEAREEKTDKPISPVQIAAISEILGNDEMRINAFCSANNIQVLSDIPKREYKSACNVARSTANGAPQ
jgi:hypothetical protein